MSAQLTLTASHSESKFAACLHDWPLPGWQTITTPRVTRYLRLQQSAAHWKNRQCDWVLCLLQLYSEEQAGINHRTRIVRCPILCRIGRIRSSRTGPECACPMINFFSANHFVDVSKMLISNHFFIY